MKAQLAIAFSVLLLVVGCSESTSDGTPNAERTSSGARTDAATPSPKDNNPSETLGGDLTSTLTSLPESCDISTKDITLFSRDWGRVAGAVGRPDLQVYTGPFVDEVASLAQRGKSCPGAAKIVELAELSVEIDTDARGGEVKMEDITKFRSIGNSWLKALGYGEDVLPTG